MRTLAICNLKGGVGRTTLTFNLGAALARLGHSVLLIDADAKGCLTDCLEARKVGYPTLAEVLRGQATTATAARPTQIPRLSVIASSPALDKINQRTLAGERVLLARMQAAYDYTLIDCSACTGIVMINACIAADEIIAPVQARGLAGGGIRRLLSLVRELRLRRANPALDLSGIVINRYDAQTAISPRVTAALRKEYGALVLDTVMTESEQLAESTDLRQPVGQGSGTSAAALEVNALAGELVSRQRRLGYFSRAEHKRTMRTPTLLAGGARTAVRRR